MGALPSSRRRKVRGMMDRDDNDDGEWTPVLLMGKSAAVKSSSTEISPDLEPIPISKSRKVFIGFSIVGVFFVWGVTLSVLPPFFPSEAEAKGTTPAQYGFIFGISYLAAFLTAPAFASLGTRIEPKVLFNIGSLCEAIFGGILFALLDYVHRPWLFLALGYTFRLIYGVSDAACYGSILAILIKLFPEKAATLVSFTEISFGFGYTVGPAVGSLLYEYGGFQLPFYVVGVLGILYWILLVLIVPSVNGRVENGNDVSDNNGKDLTVREVAKCPSIWFPCVDNVALQLGYGFIESMLEPYAKEAAGLTQIEVGIVFLVMGAAYMTCSPAVGHFCDKLKHPAFLTLMSAVGNLCMLLSMSLFGPLPLLTVFSPSKALIFAAAISEGLGNGFNVVSTFARSNLAASNLGYKDDINRYLVVTGLWTTSFFFGQFLGPTLAGFLVDRHGFRLTTGFFSLIYLASMSLDLVDAWWKISSDKRVAPDLMGTEPESK